MRKRLLAAATVATLGVAGVSTGAAFATTNSGDGSDPMSSLVSALASKFDLNKEEVQAVFDEQREAMDAEREQELKDKVAALVEEGSLTQAQADAINEKRAELKKEREADRDSTADKTAEERKSEMEEKRTALDTWLEDNDIDQKYAYLLMGGHGRGHGPGGPGGLRGETDSAQ
jgi:Skp family chaperone for outer membrane proteins